MWGVSEWGGMLGNDKRIESVSLSHSFFLSPPKKTRTGFLLVIYYASLGVVNCSSTWKRPFFSLAMIADQDWTYKQFWLGFFAVIEMATNPTTKLGHAKIPCSTMEPLSPLLKRGTQVLWKGLNACIKLNGQGARMLSCPCLANASTGGAHAYMALMCVCRMLMGLHCMCVCMCVCTGRQVAQVLLSWRHCDDLNR